MHTSGHAVLDDLKAFVSAIDPVKLVPIHTFNPEEYAKYWGDKVVRIKDGQEITVGEWN